MSTEFVSVETGEVEFVRFFGGRDRGVCFEFGTDRQFRSVMAMVQMGFGFTAVDGTTTSSDPETFADFVAMDAQGRVTCGEFPFTVEVGSGDFFKFTEEV